MNSVKDQTTIGPLPPATPILRVTTIAESRVMLSPGHAALIVAVVTLVGAGLRFHLLAAPSVWIDEASSIRFATMPWWPFFKLLWSQQGNMTLYYLVLRAWIHLGDSEFVVRSLSVIFGVLTLPAIYMLGRRLFDQATGLVAVVLLSVHTFNLQWSQQARAYSLLTLLLVLTAYVLVNAMEESRKRRYWIAFSVAAALCVYAHIFAILVLAAYALACVFPRPFRVDPRMLVSAGVLFAFLTAPMAAFVLLHRNGQIDWIPRPTMADIYAFLDFLTSHGGALLLVIYFGLCGLAVWFGTKIARPDKESWSVRLLLLWLVLPPVLTLVASFIKPVFFARYLVMCVPALVILAARGLIRVCDATAVRRWACVAILLVMLSLSGWGLHRYFEEVTVETSDWRSATSYILERQQLKDGAVFFIPNTYSYLYYAHRDASQRGRTQSPDILYPPTPSRPVSREEIRRVTSGHPRVWLVLYSESDYPRSAEIIKSTLAETFQLQEKRLFTPKDPLTVALYVREKAAR